MSKTTHTIQIPGTETPIRVRVVTIDAEKDARENKRWQRGQFPHVGDTCFCCGRKAKDGTTFLMDTMIDGELQTVAVHRDDASLADRAMQLGDIDALGWYPLGSTCARAIGSAYRTR